MITCNGIQSIFITDNFFVIDFKGSRTHKVCISISGDNVRPSDYFLSYLIDKVFWIEIHRYFAVQPFGNLLFHKKKHVEVECMPGKIWYPAFLKSTIRPASCWKNLQIGGSRVLPPLAALEWDQIAARSAFFEDETKRIGINISQAEDEKSQAKDEKAR